MSLGVAPLDFRCNDPVGSTADPLRGVCIPEGVEVPLAVRLDERKGIQLVLVSKQNK